MSSWMKSAVLCEACKDRVAHHSNDGAAIIVGKKPNGLNRLIHNKKACRKRWERIKDERMRSWPELREQFAPESARREPLINVSPSLEEAVEVLGMKRVKEMDDPRNGWYVIDPKVAQELLDNQVKNRPLGRAKIQRIVKQLEAGKWVANGETLIFDHNGKLCDGQHRLQASILAGKPIRSYCVFMKGKLSDEFFKTIDQGGARTAADLIGQFGGIAPTQVAAVCRLLFLYETGRGYAGSGNLASAVTYDPVEIYEKNKADIDYAVGTVLLMEKELKGWLAPSKLAFAYLMARRVNKEKADRWVNMVAYGEGLDASSPVMKLRKMLQADAMTKSRRFTNPTVINLVAKSWVFYKEDFRPLLLSWSDQEDNIRFDGKPPRETVRRRNKSNKLAKAS